MESKQKGIFISNYVIVLRIRKQSHFSSEKSPLQSGVHVYSMHCQHNSKFGFSGIEVAFIIPGGFLLSDGNSMR